MKKLMLLFLMAVTTFGAAFSQSSMAHVNTQKVLDTMPSRKSAMKELANFEERAVKELQETQQKLQADYQKLTQEQGSMSPTAFKFQEERLMKKSQEFQTRQQELDEQIQILSQELNAPILERVQKAVETVCKAEKIDYVVDESSLLYSGGRNLTPLVVKEVLKMEKEATSTSTEGK
ncbi:OmpH family outer membrane protein [Brumimicrobium aurantiacum]|uniref:OmpH family outer membrane protein n=1 Tax=Brumimicrobium aurantiacum TaxID=1737063 RepID=A0A3E1EY93_9FLAO|nr:OmpH family outer membrane protein [Brumimicrobium aurantiacum]RFC54530.1 OmpH family outer membrane protein [Brumimicrobium aurantiacum]